MRADDLVIEGVGRHFLSRRLGEALHPVVDEFLAPRIERRLGAAELWGGDSRLPSDGQ